MRCLAPFLLAVFLTSCGSGAAEPPAPDPASVSTIRITPQLDTIRYSELTRFSAEVRDARGNPVDSVPVWYALTADHLPVEYRLVTTPERRFVAAEAGSYIVYARIRDVIDSARLVVTRVPVRAVRVIVDSPALPDTILLRQRVRFGVQLFDSVGGELDQRVAAWSVSDPANASADERGIVASNKSGSLTVTALVEGVSAGRTVHVRDLASDSLAAGMTHACALVAQGEAWCWGRNADAAGWANGSPWRPVAVPTRVSAPVGFVQLTAGADYSCGLAATGAAWCWGANDSGQLGNGDRVRRGVATPVVGGIQFVELAAGLAFTCGRTLAGALWCWGSNRFGQLGNGDTLSHTAPVRVAGSQVWQSLAAGDLHACAVAADGVPWCWGDNSSSNQLGVGVVPCDVNNYCTSPLAMETAERFVRVSAGRRATCGITTSGQTHCWGNFDMLAMQVRRLPNDPGLVQVQLDRSVNDRPCVIAGVDATGGAWCWNESAQRTSLGSGVARLWMGDGFIFTRGSGGMQARGLNLWGQLAHYDTDGVGPFPLIGQR